MDGMEDAARLLKEAEVLYERHWAGRRDPFNVFTALRSPSDEVNLHSRFLHALLDHRKPGAERRRANLEDFTKEFWPTEHMPGFTSDGAKVERERHNIDILITNGSRQALAIENKIYARDQDGQIKRYYCKLKEQRYRDVYVLYLTIDGHDPSEDSRGNLGEKEYRKVAYGKILGWLGRCQKRAYDEPELRESVAQYLHLVRNMTGNDRGKEYMDELKKLLLQGNNLTISRDLEKAAIDARVHAMHRVWQKIEDGSKESPNLFGDTQDRSDISEDRIKKAIRRRRGKDGRLFGWFGLYYSSGIENAWLGVEASRDEGFIVGVRCWKQENESHYEKIRKKFEDMGGDSRDWWPWFEVVRCDGTGLKLDRDDLVALSSLSDTNDSRDREALAQCIRRKLEKVRERLDLKN